MSSQILSVAVEVTGIGAIIWGCALIAPFLGFIIGGILLVLLGFVINPVAIRTEREDST